jgi:hypothetical protein
MTSKLGKRGVIMNKEEILAKAQNDNKGMDVADLEVQQKGAYIAYFVGIIGIILVDIINGIVFKVINHGPNMVISLMCFTAFIIKYIKLRKKHELLVSIIYLILSIMFLVFWILQLVKVW